jgi:hypothetical protein
MVRHDYMRYPVVHTGCSPWVAKTGAPRVNLFVVVTSELIHIDIWIHNYDLSVGLAPMIKALASKVRNFITSKGMSNNL